MGWNNEFVGALLLVGVLGNVGTFVAFRVDVLDDAIFPTPSNANISFLVESFLSNALLFAEGSGSLSELFSDLLSALFLITLVGFLSTVISSEVLTIFFFRSTDFAELFLSMLGGDLIVVFELVSIVSLLFGSCLRFSSFLLSLGESVSDLFPSCSCSSWLFGISSFTVSVCVSGLLLMMTVGTTVSSFTFGCTALLPLFGGRTISSRNSALEMKSLLIKLLPILAA